MTPSGPQDYFDLPKEKKRLSGSLPTFLIPVLQLIFTDILIYLQLLKLFVMSLLHCFHCRSCVLKVDTLNQVYSDFVIQNVKKKVIQKYSIYF